MFDMPFLIEKMESESIPRSHKRTKDSKVGQITMLCNLRRKTRDYINGKSRRNFHLLLVMHDDMMDTFFWRRGGNQGQSR